MKYMDQVQKLVGNITEEQMKFTDAFVHKNIGVFMPVAGPCYYAQSPDHMHPGYMFVLSFDDKVKTKIGDKIVSSEPGKLFALAPNIKHQEITESDIPRYIAIIIDSNTFETEAEQYNIPNLRFNGFVLEPDSKLLYLLKQFMSEAENRLMGYNRILDAVSIEIMHSILRSVVNLKTHSNVVSHRLEINKVIEYINLYSHEPITLKDMANHACMSSSHFSRVFKLETGITPNEYLISRRLQNAKMLLRDSTKPINSIAADCGFSSPSYLSSSFQKKYKITPIEFQRKLNNSTILK